MSATGGNELSPDGRFDRAWAEGSIGKVVAVRLKPGDDLLGGMIAVAEEAGLVDAIILGGVASLHRLSLRNIHTFPDDGPITTMHRHSTYVDGPLEVVSLTGNLAARADGTSYLHCHVVASVGEPATVLHGGHLEPGSLIATTAEVFLASLTGLTLARRHDPTTWADEIHPRPVS